MISRMWSRLLPMPSPPMASCAGQAIFLSATMTGPGVGLQPVGGLLDDLQRLVHLVDADPQAAVGVAGRRGSVTSKS